jgi:hypothetical protein
LAQERSQASPGGRSAAAHWRQAPHHTLAPVEAKPGFALHVAASNSRALLYFFPVAGPIETESNKNFSPIHILHEVLCESEPKRDLNLD